MPKSASSSSARWRPKTSSSASKSAHPRTAWCISSRCTRSAGWRPPGDPIMLIVPEADLLAVEAKIWPQDIDQLQVGQAAGLRFSAFNQRTTPEISGTISRISADVSTDQRSGQSFYTVRIALPAEEIARLGNVKLVPGMPVEAFMKTYDRTVLSYFIKPLEDQVLRAFRER